MECTVAETFNWHFLLAFSYRNDVVLMPSLCVMENASGNNSSVAGAGKIKPHRIPWDNAAHAEIGKEIM